MSSLTTHHRGPARFLIGPIVHVNPALPAPDIQTAISTLRNAKRIVCIRSRDRSRALQASTVHIPQPEEWPSHENRRARPQRMKDSVVQWYIPFSCNVYTSDFVHELSLDFSLGSRYGLFRRGLRQPMFLGVYQLSAIGIPIRRPLVGRANGLLFA